MPEQTAASQLVYTKLNQPRITTQFVERERLYAALDMQRPLTVVVAPAGYGKTTLVSSWAARSGLPCSWLSLDAGDNQLSVFIDYFLAAVERIYPQIIRQGAPGPLHGVVTSYSTAARKLGDVLDDIDERFAIVLDDYHFIAEADIHRFLAELLRFPPRGLNLIISTRAEPPLPLAALRARAQMAEIRTRDLRFTFDEAAEYLQRELNQTVDAKTLALVEESAEGWITGLHLAVLYLQHQREPSAAAAQLKGHNRFTADYLAFEVLAKQGAETQEFLLKTSILQRMSPALCDAVMAAPLEGAEAGSPGGSTAVHGRLILDFLDSQNLFITTLDDNQQWYRYHHLFQQLLELRLRATYSKDKIAALYCAASRWCAEQELIDEAIAYSSAAGDMTGDMTGAIALIEAHRHAAMNAERWQQLERWLNLLRRQRIDMHPELILLEAWVLHKRQRLSEIAALLDLAEALRADESVSTDKRRLLGSEIAALRSQQYFNRPDVVRAYQEAQRALDCAPAEYASVRGLAWIFLGAGLFLAKGKEQALAILTDNLGSGYTAHSYEYGRLLIIKCFVYWMAADMPSMERTATELLRFAQPRDLPESILWAHYFHGCACYQQNDLAVAYDDFLMVTHNQHLAPGFLAIQGPIGLALVLQAQDQDEAAAAAATAVLDYAQQTGNDLARQAGLAFGAALALRQGRIDDAAQWASGVGYSFVIPPVVTLFAPPLAVAAILLQHGTQAALSDAEQMIEQMGTFLAEAHVTRFYVEVLAMKAQLYARRGQRTQALGTLGHAVTMAYPGDLQRVFLDLGPQIGELLAQLDLDGERGTFVRRLCTAADHPAASTHSSTAHFPVANPVASSIANPVASPVAGPAGLTSAAGEENGAAPRAPAMRQPRHPDLLELLTNREMEVLQLLALRLTNKEIAQSLGISTGTVKQHTINLFRKLHAENRREAILQARAMGFEIETPYPL